MHLIPLLSIILHILFDEILATAAQANNGISDKLATSSSLASDPIRSLATNTTTTVTKTTAIITSTSAAIRNDLLCNNGSEFVCVCQQNAGNLLKHYNLCKELIELEELPIIAMNIRRVNLGARLHTNETYESYFKRRIAAIISNYCEQQADECIATTLRLKKENVVILSVKSNLQSTTVNFVITKSQRRSPLNNITILDSIKVKYVLSAQLAALSRILGGVRIEQIEMAVMKKYRSSSGNETTQRDNFVLLLILSIVATFLTITYTIAAIRVCRDCYAKRQIKKNASKLNYTFKTSNYGTCMQGKQSGMNRNHKIQSTVRMKTSKGNDPDNSNPGEIAVMDTFQMKRMFQCDPSQLPAEESPSLPQISNDLFVIFAPKYRRDSKSKVLCSQPKHTVHQSVKMEEKNSPISFKIDKLRQGNEDITELPQKYNNAMEENKHIDEEFLNYDPNSTTNICQSKFPERQIEEFPTSICNQMTDTESLQPTYKQSKTISDLTNSNFERTVIEKGLEATYSQPAIRNESYWLSTLEPREKPCEEIISSFDKVNHYNGTKNSESDPSDWETRRCIDIEVEGLKRISLANQLNYIQGSKTLNCLAKNGKLTYNIQKSRTIHQFHNVSSESDDESDIYHKLSEVGEETAKSLEFTSISFAEFMEDPRACRNGEDFGTHLNMQSFISARRFEISTDQSYYEHMQESPITITMDLNSTPNQLTPEHSVNFTPTEDLK